MKTETKRQYNRRTMRFNMRGQDGSARIRHVYPVIDLNWQRMNERQEGRKPYSFQQFVDEPAVRVADAYPNLGSIFGDTIVVRGSPDYYF